MSKKVKQYFIGQFTGKKYRHLVKKPTTRLTNINYFLYNFFFFNGTWLNNQPVDSIYQKKGPRARAHIGHGFKCSQKSRYE